MDVKPHDQRDLMIQNKAERQRRVREEALPVIVTVSEISSDPHSFSQAGGGQTPRLAVIGCSEMITNKSAGENEADLVRGTIDWCRKRDSNIGIQPKSHQNYVLSKTVKGSHLIWLPILLVLLSITGLGVVVWNVRRR